MNEVTKDLALLLLGAIAGLLPWLLDKVGVEMPKGVYIGLLVISVVLVWWALIRLEWLAHLPLLGGKSVSLPTAVLSCVAVAVVLLIMLIGQAKQSDYTAVPLSKLEHIENREFVNSTVDVDGKYFIRCHLTNVRLRFQGKKEFALTNNQFDGPVILEATELAVKHWGSAVVGLLRNGQLVNLDEVGFGANDEIRINKRPH